MMRLLTACFLIAADRVSTSFQPLEEFFPRVGKNDPDFSKHWKTQSAARPSFFHDNNGNVLQAANATATVWLTYNSINQPETSQQIINGLLSATITHGYDLNGNRTNIIYPGGGLIVTYKSAILNMALGERLLANLFFFFSGPILVFLA